MQCMLHNYKHRLTCRYFVCTRVCHCDTIIFVSVANSLCSVLFSSGIPFTLEISSRCDLGMCKSERKRIVEYLTQIIHFIHIRSKWQEKSRLVEISRYFTFLSQSNRLRNAAHSQRTHVNVPAYSHAAHNDNFCPTVKTIHFKLIRWDPLHLKDSSEWKRGLCVCVHFRISFRRQQCRLSFKYQQVYL